METTQTLATRPASPAESGPNARTEPEPKPDLRFVPVVPDSDISTRLTRLAAAGGPLRRALARLAGRLVETGAIERLCYARLGDYARECLGLSPRRLQELARIDRALPGPPSLDASLRRNLLPWCKVRLIARIATPEAAPGGAHDGAALNEAASEGRSEIEGEWRAAWVAWAQRVTVRRLTEDVERALLLRAVQGRVWRQRRDHPETVLDPIPAGERQLCAPGAPGVDPEATERLAWWVPVEVALLFTGVRETLRRRLEAEAEAEDETETRAKTNERAPVSDGEVFEALTCAGSTPGGSGCRGWRRRGSCSSWGCGTCGLGASGTGGTGGTGGMKKDRRWSRTGRGMS